MPVADLIKGDPAVLAGYRDATVPASAGLVGEVDGYTSAWSSLLAAPARPPISPPPSREASVRDLVFRVGQLDREPAALGEALRLLDADGDGTLRTDDCTSAELVALFVQERGKDPTATADAIRNRAALVLATGVDLVTVVRDGSDGSTRVVSLDLDALGTLDGMSEAEVQRILELYGLTGADGAPVHFVMHGWNGDATDAAEHTADAYDSQGVDGATVIAVNWDADSGQLQFDEAEGSAHRTGDSLTKVFTALAASNPDANVAVTAHSLGNHVALRALSQMEDPVDPVTGRTLPFSVDYTGIQPAVPSWGAALDPDRYGALLTDRISDLTLTVNNDDGALFWYEARPWGDGYFTGAALGDEAADSDAIRLIQEVRAGNGAGGTHIVDQNSGDGDGHLAIDPHDSELVDSLLHEQIDRVEPDGDGASAQTAARRYVYDLLPDGNDDRLFETDGIQDYLHECQRLGIDPDHDRLLAIAQDEVRADPGLLLD